MGQRKEILWTVLRLPRRYVIMQKDFSDDIGHSSVQVWILHFHNRRAPPRLTSSFLLLTWFVRFRAHCHLRFKKTKGKCDKDANLMIKHFEESGHPKIRGISCVQPAQYARSSIEFVWRLRWKDFWSNIFSCGQIYFKRERSAIVKLESARSGFFVKHRGSDLRTVCARWEKDVGHVRKECPCSVSFKWGVTYDIARWSVNVVGKTLTIWSVIFEPRVMREVSDKITVQQLCMRKTCAR